MPGAGGHLERTRAKTGEPALAAVGRGRGRPGPARATALHPRRPSPGQAGFPGTEVMKSKCDGETARRKMVKSNKGAGRKSRETKVFYPCRVQRSRRRGPSSVSCRHLVVVTCDCSTGCCGPSGRGEVRGDGYFPARREDRPCHTNGRSPNPDQESRPFSLEGLVCFHLKYCAI